MSILAITTPSYACGCGMTTSGQLFFLTIMILLFIVFPSFIIKAISIEKHAHNNFLYCCNGLLWTSVFFMSSELYLNYLYKNSNKRGEYSDITSDIFIYSLCTIFIFFLIKAIYERFSSHKNQGEN